MSAPTLTVAKVIAILSGLPGATASNVVAVNVPENPNTEPVEFVTE